MSQNEENNTNLQATKESALKRERKTGALSKLSVGRTSRAESEVPSHPSRASSSQTPIHGATTQSDAVSLVSEVLDAEVTALTNSSSPGSSIGSGKHPRTPLRYYQGQSKKSKSSIASSAKEQQMLEQSYSFDDNMLSSGVGAGVPTAEQSTTSGSSGIASKNTSASQNQSTASAGTSSAGEGSKSISENILSDIQNRKKQSIPKQNISPVSTKDPTAQDTPSYENWPPLVPRKTAPIPTAV